MNKNNVDVEYVAHNYPLFWGSIYEDFVILRKGLEESCDDIEHCDFLQFLHNPGALIEFLESEGEQIDFFKINDEWISLYTVSPDGHFQGYTWTLHIPTGQKFNVDDDDFNHSLYHQFMKLVKEDDEED